MLLKTAVVPRSGRRGKRCKASRSSPRLGHWWYNSSRQTSTGSRWLLPQSLFWGDVLTSSKQELPVEGTGKESPLAQVQKEVAPTTKRKMNKTLA